MLSQTPIALCRAALLLVLAVAWCGFAAHADVVILNDGRQVEGQVVDKGESIDVTTKFGAVSILKSNIKKIVRDGDLPGGNVAPSAIPDPLPLIPPPPPPKADRPAAAVPPAPARLPEPDAAAQQRAEKMIREVLKDDYAKARRDLEAMRAFSRKLLQRAAETADDPASSFVLYREAGELAARAGDIATAIEAAGAAAERFAVDATSLKAAALETAARQARTPEALAAIASAYSALADEAAEADRYDDALGFARKAESAALSARSKDLAAQARARRQEIDAIRMEHGRVMAARATLRDSPDDAAARLVVGRFLCFFKDRWEEGLPHLAAGTEGAVKRAAVKDLAKPSGPASQIEAGDAWFAAMEKETSNMAKGRAGSRARYWYEKALPGLTGIAKLKIEKRLEEKALGLFLGGAAVEIVVLAWVDGEAELRVTPRGIYWVSGSCFKPGRSEHVDEPTFVNDRAWKPAWEIPDAARGRDKSKPLAFNVGPIEWLRVEALATGSTKNCKGIESKRDPITGRVDEGEFVVSIPDTQSGAAWYKFRIVRK